MTFEPWKLNSILIRFEHILAKDEDNSLSQAVSFDFQDVFRTFEIASIRETTLAGNQWLEDVKRLNFTAKTEALNEISNTSTEQSDTMQAEKSISKINPHPHVSPRQYFDSLNKVTSKRHRAAEYDANDFTITLKPMEIRTFVVELEWKP